MKIEEAIQQRVFTDIRQKAGINLLYTASWFNHAITHMLKPYGISVQQFNILRILRGQKGEPVALYIVTERMIDQMSNTSRLIDKLVSKGLEDRRQCPMDRRQVDLVLTIAGETLTNTASEAVLEGTDALIGHMQNSDLEELSRLLDEMRNTAQ